MANTNFIPPYRHNATCSCGACKQLREFEKRLNSFAEMYMPKNNPPPKPKLQPPFPAFVQPPSPWAGFIATPEQPLPKKLSQLPLIVEYVIEEIEDWQREHDGVKPRVVWCSVPFKDKVSWQTAGHPAHGGDGLMIQGVRIMSTDALRDDELFPTMEAPERGFRRS